MADSIYTFDPVAANNTALDSIPYGPNQLYHNQIDNWFRALASKLAQHVDDLGGVNTVAGTANAITVTLASGITAYATGQLFWFKNTVGPNTTATFINVNSIGSVEIRLQGDTALSGGEMVDNGYYGLLYDSAYDGAAGGFVLLNPSTASVAAATTSAAGIIRIADLATTLAGTNEDRAVVPANLYFPTGHISPSLTIAKNGSDASNDIDVSAFTARDSTDTYNIVCSALTKQIDAAWAVGTNAGGLDTGSVSNTTYYIWGIKRTDTGVCDVLFSTSASSPTMPTNYDAKVLIGEFTRAGGVNGIPVVYGNPLVRFSGTAPVFACRAWVNFNGTGTVAIRSSGNVSSITDNGTGDYTVNFTTALPDANYSMGASGQLDETSGFVNTTVSIHRGSNAQTTTAARLTTGYVSTSGSGVQADLTRINANFVR